LEGFVVAAATAAQRQVVQLVGCSATDHDIVGL
jgi:hypothetical protein